MTDPSNPTAPRISASARAREFLDSIVEGSPEQDSMLWFENAPYVVRLAAFIKLDVGQSLPRTRPVKEYFA